MTQDIYTPAPARLRKRRAQIALVGAAILGSLAVGTLTYPSLKRASEESTRVHTVEFAIKSEKPDIAQQYLNQYAAAGAPIPINDRVRLQQEISEKHAELIVKESETREKDVAWSGYLTAIKQHDPETATTMLNGFLQHSRRIGVMPKATEVAEYRNRIAKSTEWSMLDDCFKLNGEAAVNACYQYMTEFPTSEKRTKALETLLVARLKIIHDRIATSQPYDDTAVVLERTIQTLHDYESESIQHRPTGVSLQGVIGDNFLDLAKRYAIDKSVQHDFAVGDKVIVEPQPDAPFNQKYFEQRNLTIPGGRSGQIVAFRLSPNDKDPNHRHFIVHADGPTVNHWVDRWQGDTDFWTKEDQGFAEYCPTELRLQDRQPDPTRNHFLGRAKYLVEAVNHYAPVEAESSLTKRTKK